MKIHQFLYLRERVEEKSKKFCSMDIGLKAYVHE